MKVKIKSTKEEKDGIWITQFEVPDNPTPKQAKAISELKKLAKKYGDDLQ
ncbi:MAG: hypothetical protein WC648_05215 [Candidatus Paceibacterota bacterium]|jgi:hypothetical protein